MDMYEVHVKIPELNLDAELDMHVYVIYILSTKFGGLCNFSRNEVDNGWRQVHVDGAASNGSQDGWIYVDADDAAST
eukprot:1283611-Amphidinium_carterae.1